MADTDKRPIIIVKRVKKSHDAHHGGSWKVAYADFVTAMMAFFMVMWILGLDDNVRQSVEDYFSNPTGVKNGYAAGTNPLVQGGAPPALPFIGREAQKRRFEEIAERLRARLDAAGLGDLDAEVEIVVTDEGLRIELVEGESGKTFFRVGSAALRPAARQALRVIARELRPLAHNLVVEGHTDAAQYGSGGYTNWELSADRANAARRALEQGGVSGRNVVEVRGYADRNARLPGNPFDPSNRRISVLLPYSDAEPLSIPPPGEAGSFSRTERNAGLTGRVEG